MQAIQTKYLSPTNSRGARIKASCAAGSITISYPYELSGQAVHRKAAEALVAKLGWTDLPELLGGCLPDNSYCFVFNVKFSKE
jgi:hypothetical protein